MERETPVHDDSEVDEDLIDVDFNISEYVTNLLLLDAKRGKESTKLQRKEELERVVVVGDEVFPEKEADEIKLNEIEKEKEKVQKKKEKKKKKFLQKFKNSKLERRRSFGVIPSFTNSSLKRVQQTKSGDDTFFRNSSLPGFSSKLTDTNSQSSLSEIDSLDAKSLSLTDFESDMDNARLIFTLIQINFI